MVMRNPKPAQSAKAKKRDEASKDTPSSESPIVEETSNGEQPSQPPVMKELATEPETAAPNSERVSALAVVSVVSSLFGFLGITSLLGLGLGIVALRQMATNPQLSGRHLAILGVCLSVFWLVLLLAMGSVLWVGMSLLKTLFNAIF
jgi:hypothetical protein